MSSEPFDLTGTFRTQQIGRRGALRLFAASAGAILLAACGGSAEAPASSGAAPAAGASGSASKPAAGSATSSATSGATGSPKIGGTLKALAGGNRITLAQGYDPALNPGARAENLMFEGLTKIQDDFTIAPSLATSWTVSQDGKSYTFKLRPGVKFHNGRDMVADDVKFSLDRILDPKTLSPYRLLFSVVDGVDAPDPTTAVVRLKQPYAPLLALLADDPSFIVPKEEVAKPTFAMSPVGTGPFKFVSHQVNKNMILERHKDYWEKGFPRLDRLEVTDVLDLQADFLRFKAGEFDVFLEAPEDQFAAVKSQFQTVVSKDTNYVYWRFNFVKVPQFKDPRVIQAMSWAIDRKALADFSLPPELAFTNGGSGSMVAWAAPKEPFLYPKADLVKAKQLLQDAGVSNLKFEIQTMSSVAYLPKSIQVVQQMLSQIGINVTLTVLDRAPAATQWPTIDSYLGGSPGSYDPDFEMSQWFLPGGSSNVYNFSDDQLTQLLTQARTPLDQTERGNLYRQAQTRAATVSNTMAMYNNWKFHVSYPYVKELTYPGPAEHRWPDAKLIWLDK